MNWNIREQMSNFLKARNHKSGPADDVDQLTSLEHKIKAVMAKTFKLDIHLINDDTSSDNLDRWTSLAHVDLVLNLQQAFEIEFSDSQIVEELLNYRTIVKTVAAALRRRSHG